MDKTGEKDVIRRRDVPWHRNGTIMKYIFMVAGLCLVCGMLFDPSFPVEARAGLVDALIAFLLGTLCGWPVGRMMARTYERDTTDRRSLCEEAWLHSFDPRKLAYAALFLVAVAGAGVASGYLSIWAYLGLGG